MNMFRYPYDADLDIAVRKGVKQLGAIAIAIIATLTTATSALIHYL